VSERDPVVGLLEELDGPVEPRPEFAEALRARLLDELDQSDGAPARPVRRWPRRGLHVRLRRPLLAGVIALAVAAIAIAAVVVSRPSPASALDVIRQARAAFAHTPPFQATFKVAFNPDGAKGDRFVPKGATETVLFSYGGRDRFRLQVVAEHPGHRIANESNPGYYEVSDGRHYGFFEPRGKQTIFQSYPVTAGSRYPALAGLSWHVGYPNWDRVCRGPGSTVLADVPIAGRDARHIRCTDFTGQTWQLWIDRQTGLILKIVGQVALGDSFLGGGPTTTSKGGFQVEKLRYHPSFPAGTFAVKAPPGAVDPEARQRAALAKLPPFHAVFAERGHPNYVDEAWWQDEHTWRRQRLYERRSDPSFIGPGSFSVRAHGPTGTYNARTDTFSPNSATLFALQDPAQQLLAFDPLYPGAHCTIIGHEPIAGRRTNHYRCGGDQVWVDAATGLTLSFRYRHSELRVRSIQYHPHFPARIFRFTRPAGSRNANKLAHEHANDPYYNTKLAPGQPAPNWHASTLAGGRFQVSDVRGKPTLFLILPADNCSDPVCNLLAPLERAYRRSNGATRPVWVDWGGTPRGAKKLARYDHLTYPVVVDHKGASFKAWAFNAYPYWLLLDAHGRVIAARRGIQTVAQIEQLLARR
jgi:hypothetical protein